MCSICSKILDFQEFQKNMYMALNNKKIKVKFTNMEKEILDITTSNYFYKISRLIDSELEAEGK